MIFDKFLKKNTASGKTPQGKSEPFDPLKYLAEKYEDKGAQIQGVDLFFPSCGLTLRIHTGSTNSANERCSVQLIFILTHPLFEEELVESCAGMGISMDAAKQLAVENFDASVLLPVIAALGCTGSNRITAKTGSESIFFRVPDITPMIHIGRENNFKGSTFWDKLSEDIPSFLGKKSAYWIKMYTAWTGSELIAEVRINGAVIPELTEKLKGIAEKPADTKSFSSDKQFILLIQTEPCTPAPYTREQVKRLTYDAIDRLMQLSDGDSRDEALNAIADSAPAASLGYELVSFIPEIYCATVLGCSDDGCLTASSENGSIPLRASQLRSYGWISDAIRSYISDRHPDKDQNLKILCMSSRFSAAHQALMNGAKLDDLFFSGLMYNVPDDYEII